MLTITADHYTLISSMLADVAARITTLRTTEPTLEPAKHPLVTAATILTVRVDELIRDDVCSGAVSIKAKSRSLDGTHPVLLALRELLERHGQATEFDDYWATILDGLRDANTFGWADPAMKANALILLLMGAVQQETATTFCVTSSKPYYPTLTDARGDLDQGFACTCKWFYTSQGESPCKHVLAAAMQAFATPATA